jgi:hypothetical protein
MFRSSSLDDDEAMMMMMMTMITTTQLVMRLHDHDDHDHTEGSISHRAVPSIHPHVLTPSSTAGTTLLTMSYRRSILNDL